MKKVVILGCTGSIGTQALEIVAASDELSVVGLAAESSWEQTLQQAHARMGCRRLPSPTRTPPRRRPMPGTDACSPARRGSAS